MACDGGKDSLSMAASAGGETVKAPGNLVVSAYVSCPDITATVTPDLKLPGSGRLLHVDLAAGRRRLGGSNLAQAFSQVRYLCMRGRHDKPLSALPTALWHIVFEQSSASCICSLLTDMKRPCVASRAHGLVFCKGSFYSPFAQIGDESSDVDIGAVGAAFNVTQRLLEERRISAGHDVSDGGLAVALLEMAFAGNVGITADISPSGDDGGPLAALFAEELGLLVEVGAPPYYASLDADTQVRRSHQARLKIDVQTHIALWMSLGLTAGLYLGFGGISC